MLKKQVSKLFKQLSLLALAVTLVLSTNIQPVHADEYGNDGYITAELRGTTSCSVTANSNGRGSWATASNSKICYANVVKAVGIIEIKITGSTSSSLDSSHSSHSFGCTASIQDISASGSGNTTVLLNVGETPVSGQIQITLNTNAGITSFSTGYTSTTSCSVVSVKYKTVPTPSFNSKYPLNHTHI